MIHVINPGHVFQLNAAGVLACFLLSKMQYYRGIASVIKAYLFADTPPPGRANANAIRLFMPDDQSGIFLSYEWWCYHFVKT